MTERALTTELSEYELAQRGELAPRPAASTQTLADRQRAAAEAGLRSRGDQQPPKVRQAPQSALRLPERPLGHRPGGVAVTAALNALYRAAVPYARGLSPKHRKRLEAALVELEACLDDR